jgi:hypothetical protein
MHASPLANVGWAKAQRAVPTLIIAVLDQDVGFATLSPPYELCRSHLTMTKFRVTVVLTNVDTPPRKGEGEARAAKRARPSPTVVGRKGCSKLKPRRTKGGPPWTWR